MQQSNSRTDSFNVLKALTLVWFLALGLPMAQMAHADHDHPDCEVCVYLSQHADQICMDVPITLYSAPGLEVCPIEPGESQPTYNFTQSIIRGPPAHH